MGIFGSKGGLQDHGPVRKDIPSKWRKVESPPPKKGDEEVIKK